MKTALITGITGQDGSYLAELLLQKNYRICGLIRRSSGNNFDRIQHILNQITIYDGDLSSSTSIIRVIQETQPDEIYNLAAQSDVYVSFQSPEYTGDIDALGTLRILEAIRVLGLADKTRFYQASTSELFGKTTASTLSETSPFQPCSPYAIAKQYAFWMVKEYRDAYGMFAVNGILFNHESERRGEQFVTRKITRASGRIAEGLQDYLELGNLNSMRDWGYAADYVKGMWLMLQQQSPDDYVIATGKKHSVRDFVELSFSENGIPLRWEGTGVNEKGYDLRSGKLVVTVNPRWFRPTDVDNLCGNPQKAIEQLGWDPGQTSFEELVQKMTRHDRLIAQSERRLRQQK